MAVTETAGLMTVLPYVAPVGSTLFAPMRTAPLETVKAGTVPVALKASWTAPMVNEPVPL